MIADYLRKPGPYRHRRPSFDYARGSDRWFTWRSANGAYVNRFACLRSELPF